MISGIGLDIIEIERIVHVTERTPKFINRILTTNEKKIYESLKGSRKNEFLAGRFAAKEAFAKAKGTGIGASCSFLDIEVQKGELGKPELFFKGKKVDGFVSITHTENYAAAQVLLLVK